MSSRCGPLVCDSSTQSKRQRLTGTKAATLERVLNDLTKKFGHRCVVFDLETTSGDLRTMRITRGVALSTATRCIHVFTEADVVIKLRDLLNGSTIVVAHNHTFDYAAMSKYVGVDIISKWRLGNVFLCDDTDFSNQYNCEEEEEEEDEVSRRRSGADTVPDTVTVPFTVPPAAVCTSSRTAQGPVVFDILETIRRECNGTLISLGNLCHTSKPAVWKSGQGIDAITMWEEDNEDSTRELVEYCIIDVLSTAVLATMPFVTFCIPVYDMMLKTQRHSGYGILDTETQRVQVFPNEFPLGFDAGSCHCAFQARKAILDIVVTKLQTTMNSNVEDVQSEV
jgi:hypothetical protein